MNAYPTFFLFSVKIKTYMVFPVTPDWKFLHISHKKSLRTYTVVNFIQNVIQFNFIDF